MVSKEDAIKLLMPYSDILKEIVAASDLDDPGYTFLLSKQSWASNRHDAMSYKATELLGNTFRPIQDSRTCMWANAEFVLRFKKIEPGGRVNGFLTKRAKTLRTEGQLSLLSQDEDDNILQLPIFYVGYQVNRVTNEIEDFLISAYKNDSPAWVMSFDELVGVENNAQLQLSMTPVPIQRTQVRVKHASKSKRATE